MKPEFALDLDNDSVRLLRRSDEGWLEVGRAALETEALDASLKALRDAAAALAPTGFASKLILPPSQILFTDVEISGNDRASQRAAIVHALKGRTPYSVSELVFDWSRTGDRARVAVVAKITLEEAESFAESYGFNPVCFVAVPEAGRFAGEPFFGTTARAAEHMPAGARLDRDQDPIRVVGVAAPVSERAIEPSNEDPPASPPTARSAETEPPLAETVQAAAPDAEPQREAAESPLATVETEAQEEARADDDAQGAEVAVAKTVVADPPPDDIAAANPEAPFIAVADEDADDEAFSVLDESLPEPESADVALGFQTRRALTAAIPADEEDLRSTEKRLHLETLDPLPDLPASRVSEGMASITAPALDVPTLPSEEDEPIGAAARKLRNVTARMSRGPIPDAVHGTIAQQKLRRAELAQPHVAAPGATASVTQRSRAPRIATSTAAERRRRTIAVVGGIVFLSLVAIALELYFLSGDTNRTQPTTATLETAPAVEPAAPTAEVAATVDEVIPPSDMTDGEAQPAPADGATEAASTATEVPPVGTETAPQSPTDVAVATALGESAATDSQAAAIEAPPVPAVAQPRNVPQAAPAASPLPEADAIGAPKIAEAAPLPGDLTGPAALPDAAGEASDSAPLRQPLPPPFGTVVTFGPGGLIVPTPEGVITPGGFTLFAGKPPVVPPLRPGSAAQTTAPAPAVEQPTTSPPSAPATVAPATGDDGASAAPDADQAAPGVAQQAYSGRKPKARPDAIVAKATAARNKAEALAEAAAAAAKAEAERLASATPQAVASSRRPAGRPSGFSRAVEAAVATAVAAPVAPAPAAAAASAAPIAQVQEVDEPEPVAMAPNMPTTVTVARQATLKNALNLSDISLIGVYGSSASRRALIRMPNGRFIKVKVGDRFDGGTIAAIGDSEVSYVKGGKTVVLKMTRKG